MGRWCRRGERNKVRDKSHWGRDVEWDLRRRVERRGNVYEL